MSYKIKPAATLNHLLPGDSISAEVVVLATDPKNEDAASDYWLENVKVIGTPIPLPPQPPAHSTRPRQAKQVPDFSLTDQSGKRISLQQYRGNVLLVTFIYTRCPFPDFCPRMTSNFAEIYKQLTTNPALARTQLLSISFDPRARHPQSPPRLCLLRSPHPRPRTVHPLGIRRSRRRRLAQDRRLLRPHHQARRRTHHPHPQHRRHRSRRQNREVVSRQRLASF